MDNFAPVSMLNDANVSNLEKGGIFHAENGSADR
jgi:hypothetical protein